MDWLPNTLENKKSKSKASTNSNSTRYVSKKKTYDTQRSTSTTRQTSEKERVLRGKSRSPRHVSSQKPHISGVGSRSRSAIDSEVCSKFPLRHERNKRTSPSKSVNTAKTSSTRSVDGAELEIEYLESPRSRKGFKSLSGKGDREPEQRIVIENKIVDSRGGSCDGLTSCFTSKKIIIIIIVYAIFATGLGAFFFNRSWSLFSKQKQIELLEDQLDLLDEETKALETQIDRLENQVTKLGNETDRLEIINGDLKDTANDLNNTIALYEEANGDISESVKVYQSLNKELSASLNEATAINDILAESISALEVEVKHLQNLEMNLTATMNIIENQNSDYKSVISDLETVNKESLKQIELLEEGRIELIKQNDELDANNEHLVSILTFMKQTGIDLNTTIDELTNYLGNEINQNGILVLMSLETSYQNVYKYWTVPGIFEDLFGEKSWILDKNSPIGSTDYVKLMEYIEEHVSSEVCADIGDFENFLVNDPVIGYNGAAPPVNISFRSIRSGIERYFSSLTNHYFSSANDGVSKQQWLEAEFDCKNLAQELRFTWS